MRLKKHHEETYCEISFESACDFNYIQQLIVYGFTFMLSAIFMTDDSFCDLMFVSLGV